MAAPPGLGKRGRRLWTAATKEWQLNPAHLVLLEEACRISDRLDVLDAIIRGFEGLSGEDEAGSADITGLLAESRQQATALRGLVAEIRQGQKGVAPAAPSRAGGGGVADLTARIAKRRGSSSG
ncbi:MULTISPECIES: hypothetical protein [unclassified Streptomyces]|uniref:hypothetical protein n=1 Tax=unclassified Streptomyces TaxID=2593676 RepID=UPI002FF0D4D5